MLNGVHTGAVFGIYCEKKENLEVERERSDKELEKPYGFVEGNQF